MLGRGGSGLLQTVGRTQSLPPRGLTMDGVEGQAGWMSMSRTGTQGSLDSQVVWKRGCGPVL